MAKYRKKPVVIEAVQWLKHGDHTSVQPFVDSRNQTIEGRAFAVSPCEQCRKGKGKHGLIATLEGEHIVCPGDWIIRGVKNELYPCKPDIFEATYEPVDE